MGQSPMVSQRRGSLGCAKTQPHASDFSISFGLLENQDIDLTSLASAQLPLPLYFTRDRAGFPLLSATPFLLPPPSSLEQQTLRSGSPGQESPLYPAEEQ